MVTRNVSFIEGETYHIYNRGNSKRDIFLDSNDYQRFLILLYLANTTVRFNVRDILKNTDDVFTISRPDTLVHIRAYCLMPNHFHLIITPVTDTGLSTFMLKLTTGYSMYFNTRYEHTGSLFEGRYKARHADSDTYLKYLFSYVHLNPVRVSKNTHVSTAELFTKAVEFPYSSLDAYVNKANPRAALGLVDTELYDMYFDTNSDIKRELMDWLQFEEPTLGQP